MEDWQIGGFGLYVHWPYCISKCPYCDFNSHVASQIDHRTWAAVYVAEIARHAAETSGRVLQTIYFGGGTPSLMAPETVAMVIDAARAAWSPANDIEITLEANPSSVEVAKFRDYRQAGVNRVSLGVQALNDLDLQRLGRAHDRREALRALEIARDTFARTSFDLIYARQDQSRRDWSLELAEALSLQPDHLSLYQLTIEEGTVFARRFAAGQLRGLPGEDSAADMYQDTQDICGLHGLPAYEVSNHAAPGQESRHNMIYWTGGDYVGIGPGAHGRLTLNGARYATLCPNSPTDWLRRISTQGRGETERTALTGEERAEEYLMMGLRLSSGVDLERFRSMSGRDLSPERIKALRDLDLVRLDGTTLAATASGRMVLNRLLTELLA